MRGFISQVPHQIGACLSHRLLDDPFPTLTMSGRVPKHSLAGQSANRKLIMYSGTSWLCWRHLLTSFWAKRHHTSIWQESEYIGKPPSACWAEGWTSLQHRSALPNPFAMRLAPSFWARIFSSLDLLISEWSDSVLWTESSFVHTLWPTKIFSLFSSPVKQADLWVFFETLSWTTWSRHFTQTSSLVCISSSLLNGWASHSAWYLELDQPPPHRLICRQRN